MGMLLSQIAKLKKGYSPAPELTIAEKYVETGEAKVLAGIKRAQGNNWCYWTYQLAELLPAPSKWDQECERLVHVLAAADDGSSALRHLNELLQQEPTNGDYYSPFMKQYLPHAPRGADPAQKTLYYLDELQRNGCPNSAGRYVLGLTDDQLKQAVAKGAQNYSGLAGLTDLLLKHAPGRIRNIVDELIHSEGNADRISQEVIALLVQRGEGLFEDAVLRAVRGEKSEEEQFRAAQTLHRHAPAKYRDLALEIGRKALKAGKGAYCEDVATWMVEQFGQEVLADLEEAAKTLPADLIAERGDGPAIAAAAAKHLGLPARGVCLTVLDRIRGRKLKVSSNPYQARWESQYHTDRWATALDALVSLRSDVDRDRIMKELRDGFALADGPAVVKFLAIAGRWDPATLAEDIWKLLEHKSRPVRDAAARALARQGDAVVERASGLLGHSKADVRLAATVMLATVNTPSALAPVEARLGNEQNDDVRDAMLLALEQAWEKSGRKVTRKDIAARIQRCDDKLKEPMAKWLKEETLPSLHWSDGTKLDRPAVRYLLYRQSRAKAIAADVEAKAMYGMIDRGSSGEFARAVLDQFLASKMEASDKWALTIAGLLGDDGVVPVLGARIREWVDANRGKLAEWAVQALALLGTDASLLAVDAMSIRYRSKMKNVGKAAAEAFVEAAQAQGITPEELGDRVVPWLGFEPGKLRVIECGKVKVEVSIGLDLKLAYKDMEKGKVIKSLPKTAPAEVLAEMKDISANLKEVTKSQMLRLENLLVRQRRWPVARWKELFLAHPLLLPFAVRCLWAHYDETGARKGLFRALEDRTLTTHEDEAYTLEGTGMVGMVHPLELDEATRAAWQAHFADYEIEAPFPQLSREVVKVAESQRQVRMCKDFAKTALNAMTFKGRAERLGWYRGSVCDGGGITSYWKSFPTAGVDAILGVQDFYIGIGMDDEMKLGDLTFVRTGSVKFGSYEYDEPGKEDDSRIIPFGDVPPIVFSEVMGDMKKIAGKSGNEEDE